MRDRFTYFEFQMYVLPGALFIATALLVNWIVRFIPFGGSSSDILGSLVFLLLSFISGQIIQAKAHEAPESRLKEKYWDGLFPSQRMFFPWNKTTRPIIDGRLREDLLRVCVTRGLLTEDERQRCDEGEYTDKVLTARVQGAFDKLRYNLLDHSKFAERFEIAEAHYQMFRGLFVSAFWSAILTLLVLAVCVILQLLSWGRPLTSPNQVGLVAIIVTHLALWRCLRRRCRGAGQGFAREVARAAVSTCSSSGT